MDIPGTARRAWCELLRTNVLGSYSTIPLGSCNTQSLFPGCALANQLRQRRESAIFDVVFEGGVVILYLDRNFHFGLRAVFRVHPATIVRYCGCIFPPGLNS